MKECPKCGFFMDGFDTECKRCHYVPGQEEPSAPAAAPAQPQPQPSPVQPARTGVCPYCSNPLPSPLARLCPTCKASLVQPVAGARPTTAAAPAARAMPSSYGQNPWVTLGIGGGASVLVLIIYFVLLAATGALSKPKIPGLDDLTSPSSNYGAPRSRPDTSEFEMQPSPRYSSPSSPSYSPPNSPGFGAPSSPSYSPPPATSTAGPSSSLTHKESRFKSSLRVYEIVGDSATKSGNGWTVSGNIRNIKDKTIRTFSLTLVYEDSNGTRLGTVDVHAENIPPGGEAPFTVSIPDARASTYTEGNSSSSTQ